MSLDYTFDVGAMAGTTYNLRIEKVTEFARLPSNIPTRARRGACGGVTPALATLADGTTMDSVSCDEGGLHITGRGSYLVYKPVATSRPRVRLHVIKQDTDNSLFIDTSTVPSDATTVGDPILINYHFDQNCELLPNSPAAGRDSTFLPVHR